MILYPKILFSWFFPLVINTNQSILKEINAEYSLEGLMLKLKLQYSGHLMWRANSLEKTLMLGKIEGRRRSRQQRMRWLQPLLKVCSTHNHGKDGLNRVSVVAAFPPTSQPHDRALSEFSLVFCMNALWCSWREILQEDEVVSPNLALSNSWKTFGWMESRQIVLMQLLSGQE